MREAEDMSERIRWAAVFVGLPVLAIVVVLAHEPWSGGWPVLWLVAAGAALEAFPVPVKPDAKTSLSTVATLLALLLEGPASAMAVSLGSAVVVLFLLPRAGRLLKGIYNTAMFVLPTAAAIGVFALVTGTAAGPGAPIRVGAWIPAVVVAFAVYRIANMVLLSLAIWSTGGRTPFESLPELLTTAWWGTVVSSGFVIIAYIVHVEAGLVGLTLLLVPLVSARRSLAGVEAQRASLDRAVRSLVRLVEVKDTYTRGHAERVADMADRVAARMGLNPTERYWIRIGAVLHDVGKIGVPLEILNKPGSFTEEEYWHMRRHPDVGADLLENVDALAPAVPLVRQHHERIDGCGYPRGLKGDEVPLATRIVSAVDTWDAMTTTRPYREGLPAEVAAAEMRAFAGRQFDAEVVEQLIAEVAPELVRPVGAAGRSSVRVSAPAPA